MKESLDILLTFMGINVTIDIRQGLSDAGRLPAGEGHVPRDGADVVGPTLIIPLRVVCTVLIDTIRANRINEELPVAVLHAIRLARERVDRRVSAGFPDRSPLRIPASRPTCGDAVRRR